MGWRFESSSGHQASHEQPPPCSGAVALGAKAAVHRGSPALFHVEWRLSNEIVMNVIAHRGASAYAPENTLAAFREAIRIGTRSCEFDVQQTHDNTLVVLHDSDLRRVGNINARVNQLSLRELQDIDVGKWFSKTFVGERVPTLWQVLKLLRKLQTIHLEIKTDKIHYRGIEQRVVHKTHQAGVWSRTIISSFNHRTLHRVRTLSVDARLGYLVGSTAIHRAIREATKLRCESVHVSTRQVNLAWVNEVHHAGMKINVYTVNTISEARKLNRLGVDGIFSNRPNLLF